MKRTSRGFAIYTEFKDTYDQDVRVQESSSAEGRRCWIFCQKDGRDGLIHLGEWQAYSPHLSPKQALRVARALTRFAVARRISWDRNVPYAITGPPHTLVSARDATMIG